MVDEKDLIWIDCNCDECKVHIYPNTFIKYSNNIPFRVYLSFTVYGDYIVTIKDRDGQIVFKEYNPDYGFLKIVAERKLIELVNGT